MAQLSMGRARRQGRFTTSPPRRASASRREVDRGDRPGRNHERWTRTRLLSPVTAHLDVGVAALHELRIETRLACRAPHLNREDAPTILQATSTKLDVVYNPLFSRNRGFAASRRPSAKTPQSGRSFSSASPRPRAQEFRGFGRGQLNHEDPRLGPFRAVFGLSGAVFSDAT